MYKTTTKKKKKKVFTGIFAKSPITTQHNQLNTSKKK